MVTKYHLLFSDGIWDSDGSDYSDGSGDLDGSRDLDGSGESDAGTYLKLRLFEFLAARNLTSVL